MTRKKVGPAEQKRRAQQAAKAAMREPKSAIVPNIPGVVVTHRKKSRILRRKA